MPWPREASVLDITFTGNGARGSFDTGYRPKAAQSERSHLQRLGFREGFFTRRPGKIRFGSRRLKPKALATELSRKRLAKNGKPAISVQGAAITQEGQRPHHGQKYKQRPDIGP